jgi:RHS repeat-associated protein
VRDGSNVLGEYLWLDDMPIAVLTHEQGTWQAFPVHADHLNTTRAVMDLDNALRWSWMDPTDVFGKDCGLKDPLSLGALNFNLRFPGQVYDNESGMHYNVNRDYVPGMGRYAQSDPIGLAGGTNTYSYAEASPLQKTDPLGLATEMCKRKLDKVPFSFGPLFHQYVCVSDGKGGKTCGGLGPVGGNPFNSKGKMEFEESTKGSSCETVADDNVCIEQCIAAEFTKTPPNYSLDLSRGENCQSWANAAFATCQAQCRRRN